MQVGNVGAFYASHANRTNTAAAPAASPNGSRKSDADTVTISDAARQAAYAEQADTQAQTPQGTSPKDYPVEMYQIPAWYAHYGIEVANQLGASGNWHAAKDTKMLAAAPAERNEFTTLIDKYYKEVLHDNGINSIEDHYQAMIVNRDSSESLRRQMMEKIQGDPRLVELLAKMGK